MCGINGLISLGEPPEVDRSRLVERMNDIIRHRGPDDAGTWSDSTGRACLGHRRLSILDLSPRGHQPMVLPDGTAIVFNGEIYNFRELKRTLGSFPFQSDTDTEVLLALYHKQGKNCLEDLVGMFAFAIWDPNRGGLFLARDRIGKKPLYYSCAGGFFSFSSEISPLLSLPWIVRNLDEKAFYYTLTFGFTPPPMTMFEGVNKLEQGHCLWVDRTGPSAPERYWSLEYQKTPESETELANALRARLERSVDLRMVSDVPVGIFLSGGVDSTGLATLMRRRTNRPIRSFSISFADHPDYDEAVNARATAERLGLDHYERIVTRDDIRKMIATIAGVFDDPLVDPTCIPIYFLSEMAKEQDTKVVLTGDGPDELLLGYRNWHGYRQMYPWYRTYSALPGSVRAMGLAIGRRFISSQRIVDILYRASRGQELFWGSARSFKESEKEALLAPDFADRAQHWDCHDLIAALRSEYDRESGEIRCSDANWMAFVGLRFVIPNFFLHRADRLGMRHSVELRTPYLDHHFVTLGLSIPHRWKVHNGEPKYIFKRALEGLVPNDTLYRRKRGFCVPLREWGSDVMVDFVRDGLDKFCEKTGLIRKTSVEAHLHRFRHGDTTYTNNIWTLYFLIAWMQKWIFS